MFCPNRECPDFVEDGAPGEYVDSVTLCPKCGAALVAEWPAARPDDEATEALPTPPEGVEYPVPGDAPTADGPLVAVAAYDYPDEAEPLISALVAAGVSVYQFLDDGRDFPEQNDVPACTRVLVPQSQARLAANLLRRLEQGGA
jgi:hypothetical protein